MSNILFLCMYIYIQVIDQHQLDPFMSLVEDFPIQKKDIQTSMVQLPVVKQPSIRVRCLSCHGENDLGFQFCQKCGKQPCGDNQGGQRLFGTQGVLQDFSLANRRKKTTI